MKNKSRIIFFIVGILLILSSISKAEENDFISINTTQEMQNLFQKSNYKNYILDKDQTYPTILIKNFPTDFGQTITKEEQQKLFFMTLIPLIRKVNEEILNEKKIIYYLEHKLSENTLDSTDEIIIEDLAVKYDISTKMQGYRRYAILLKQLKLRANVIPPSLLLSMAAINTNWGKGKFLAPSNNLYRELNWYTNEGLKPEDETEDTSYRIKIYPSLYASIKDYALKLNSNVDYTEFRNMRKVQEENNQQISGRFLIPYLIFANDIPNYAGLLDYTITYHNLDTIDKIATKRP